MRERESSVMDKKVADMIVKLVEQGHIDEACKLAKSKEARADSLSSFIEEAEHKFLSEAYMHLSPFIARINRRRGGEDYKFEAPVHTPDVLFYRGLSASGNMWFDVVFALADIKLPESPSFKSTVKVLIQGEGSQKEEDGWERGTPINGKIPYPKGTSITPKDFAKIVRDYLDSY